MSDFFQNLCIGLNFALSLFALLAALADRRYVPVAVVIAVVALTDYIQLITGLRLFRTLWPVLVMGGLMITMALPSRRVLFWGSVAWLLWLVPFVLLPQHHDKIVSMEVLLVVGGGLLFALYRMAKNQTWYFGSEILLVNGLVYLIRYFLRSFAGFKLEGELIAVIGYELFGLTICIMVMVRKAYRRG